MCSVHHISILEKKNKVMILILHNVSFILKRVEGSIPVSVYNNLMNEYTSKLNLSEKNLEDLSKELDECNLRASKLDYKKCSELAREFVKSKEITRAMIVEMVKKVEIDNYKKIWLVWA